MIIAKGVIDAKIALKEAEAEREKRSLIESITTKIGEMEKTVELFGSIMETYYYCRDKDQKLGSEIWNKLVHNGYGLDFCNGFRATGEPECAFKHDNCFDSSHSIYVTDHGIYQGYQVGSKQINGIEDIDFNCEQSYKRIYEQMTKLYIAMPLLVLDIANLIDNWE